VPAAVITGAANSTDPTLTAAFTVTFTATPQCPDIARLCHASTTSRRGSAMTQSRERDQRGVAAGRTRRHPIP
jgi:hypothetical protein